MIIVDDTRHDILLAVGNPKNIRPADHIPRLHGRAQQIHILPDLVQDDRHTEQKFIPVIEPVSTVKSTDDHIAVELHRLRMHRFIVIVRRDRARQLQILRAHVRKRRIIRLLRPIEERCRAHESHTHHDHMLHGDRIQDLLINMQRRRDSERPRLTDMILLHDHRSGEFPHLIIHFAEFLRLHFRDIQSVKVMVQEHRDDPRLASRENDRIDVILSDRYPERLHDRMDVLRQRFREIA